MAGRIKLILIMACMIIFAAAFSGCRSSQKESRTDTRNEETGSIISEETAKQEEDKEEEREVFSDFLIQLGKDNDKSNPLITHMYMADPTAVEYEGRLYVYGTNDTQQYLHDVEGKNTYEKIKSIVIISTDDMVNWTYHGIIDTEKIAPWIIASWAPSIVSRVEDDGKTHFYLYFSNSGWGTGVLTSTSPTGPWEDPLGRSLIDGNTPGLGSGVAAAFDPGVVIDDNGDAWLAFGGSASSDDPEKNYMPGGARIVKLGKDMISLASDIVEIPAPYHFEANELNYINGTFVYTYCNSWASRDVWKIDGTSAPPAASMSYMTTTNPLDPDSWTYRGYYLKNPGDYGLNHSNNHTHLHKYKGQYYLFYHTLELQKRYAVNGGFRSLYVDPIEVDEETVTINRILWPAIKGVKQIESFDPFDTSLYSTHALSAGVSFEAMDEKGNMFVISDKEGSWVMVRGADFKDGAKEFTARVMGTGRMEIRLDDLRNGPVAEVNITDTEWKDVTITLPEAIEGEHDIYFLFINEGISAYAWSFK